MLHPPDLAEPPIVVGVDVGGSKVAAALVDARGGIFGSLRSPTELSSSEATLDCIASTVNRSIQSSGIPRGQISGVGVGIPGMVDPVLGIGVASVNLNWKDVAVVQALQSRLVLPCWIENDVKAAGMGEARYGAGKGKRSLVFLTIGTGVAAAVILENNIYRGSSGLAGEIGHAVIDRRGPACKCGGQGCLEALVSGPAIAARAAGKIQSGRHSVIADMIEGHTADLSARTVFEAARLDDPLALETIDDACQDLAIAIQWLALAYDPQVIVLGGGVSQAGSLLLTPLMRQVQRLASASWVFGKLYNPEFLQISRLGEQIGVLGAAALFAIS